MGSTSSKSVKGQANQILNWFEIPVHNILRAIEFYDTILGIEMQKIEQNGYAMASFPEGTGIGGALVQGQGCVPSEVGTLVYLNAGDDLFKVISKVPTAGGRIVLGKTLISKEAGYFALFIDTEGNKVALHSQN
ncbi:MAG: putative enzyme related to lactoylglutathione lyase [Bacteroidia bacterium]|jgi:predicted enzyme related to lactoylglutathione lyase